MNRDELHVVDANDGRRTELDVPEEILEIVDIDGYKFFKGRGRNELQCATCLNIMGLMPVVSNEYKKGKIRKIKLMKDCDCPKQK